MNTPVNFETSKLLKEKGFDEPTSNYFRYDGKECENKPLNWNEDVGFFSRPSIAEVVMWLYEKHEYWCYAYTNGKIWHPCIQHKFGDMAVLSGKIGEFNSPTEAYSSAILYTLNNLI